MNFGQLLAILRARWVMASIIFVTVVALGIGVTLVMPKQYKATASVVVDARPDPVSIIAAASAMLMPTIIATQAEIIQSDRVAQRVIKNLRLSDNPDLRAKWMLEAEGKGDFQQYLVDLIGQKLDVKPSKDSSVIYIAYQAPDANFAAAMANAFTEAYINTALDMRTDPAKKYTSFFNVQGKDAKEAIEKAQAKLSAFQQKHGIVASDERLDAETIRLNELTSQLVLIQSLASDSNSRQTQAAGGSGDRLQDVLTNPLIGQLKADLARQEVRLQELSAKLGENHPQVIEAKANLAELRNKVDLETKKVTGGVGVTNAINRQREAQLRAEIENQRGKILQMKAARDEGNVLIKEVESAQRTYDAVRARFDQTNLESQTTQTNLYQLTVATPPQKPSSPKVLLNIMASVFLGTIIAAASCLLRELSDRRVRTADDASGFTDMPLIGILPGPARKGARRDGLMQQRLLGLGPTTKPAA